MEVTEQQWENNFLTEIFLLSPRKFFFCSHIFSPSPRRRTPFPVQSVWSLLYTEGQPSAPHKVALGWKALQVPPLQLRLPSQGCPHGTPEDSLWWVKAWDRPGVLLTAPVKETGTLAAPKSERSSHPGEKSHPMSRITKMWAGHRVSAAKKWLNSSHAHDPSPEELGFFPCTSWLFKSFCIRISFYKPPLSNPFCGTMNMN